ncbi:hypothetical protein NM688_g5769 [Phlebia brevispora]|uniref:Uncharacterized protein n=1 Tax=Phlebia brevispora TaxID=194682 RepID=A0ACC1SPX3_9APHY|nr:hypothetical protein NM688_g5769 [Phlebia brevispora]
MLSAVAARKARLQAKGQSSTPPTSTPQQSPSPQPVQKTKSHAKPPSKRKSSSEAVSQSHKRRKVNKLQEKSARYFQEKDSFLEQEDVIIIEDDNDEDEAALSATSEEGRSSEDAASTKPKRAWSPSAPFLDSSDEEGAAEGVDTPLEVEEVELPRPARLVTEAPSVLSTYRPIESQNLFVAAEDELVALGLPSALPAKVLCLAQSDRLALIGTYTLCVIHGFISLAGVTLTPSRTSYRVYAPRSAPSPVIECLPTSNQPPSTLAGLPERLQTLTEHSDAIVVLQAVKSGVEGLGRICRTFENVFEPSRWQRAQGEIDIGLSSAHYVTHETPESPSYNTPASWNEAILSVMPPEDTDDVDLSRQVYLVRGAKKSGKSTFARTLLNNLTTRYRKVAFLECDLGQSEFTPGGMVALNIVSTPAFGPPFTHPSIPYQAHYIGSTSPRNCPSLYVEAITALVQTYNAEVQHAPAGTEDTSDARISDIIPLVVNMMGWTKGLGADLSSRIQEIVEPSAVFDFDAAAFTSPADPMHVVEERPPRTGDSTPAWKYVEPISPGLISARYSPTDYRNLSILSYLHAVLPRRAAISNRGAQRIRHVVEYDRALMCQPPFELAASDALDDVILVGPGSEDVVPSEINRVLNGALVALVSCEPGAVDRVPDNAGVPPTSSIPYTQGVTPPLPSMSSCHGLALIRSLTSDSSSTTAPALLHLLTPLPASILSGANPRVLVKGEMELPVWGMLDFRSEDSIAGVEYGKVPYLQWGKSEGVGGERRRIRRNLMRRGQM